MSEFQKDRDTFMSVISPEDWFEGTDISDVEQTVAGVQDYITQLEEERDEINSWWEKLLESISRADPDTFHVPDNVIYSSPLMTFDATLSQQEEEHHENKCGD